VPREDRVERHTGADARQDEDHVEQGARADSADGTTVQIARIERRRLQQFSADRGDFGDQEQHSDDEPGPARDVVSRCVHADSSPLRCTTYTT
jgi:hypothetical protein